MPPAELSALYIPEKKNGRNGLSLHGHNEKGMGVRAHLLVQDHARNATRTDGRYVTV